MIYLSLKHPFIKALYIGIILTFLFSCFPSLTPALEKSKSIKPVQISTIGAEFYSFSYYTRYTAQLEKIKPPKGVYVVKVYPNTPAQKAGLLEGDIIKTLNDKKIKHYSSLITNIEATPPDTDLRLLIIRNEEAIPLNVKTVNSTTLTNPEFQAYWVMKTKFETLTNALTLPLDKSQHYAILSALASLVTEYESKAKQRGDILLAQKYASLRQYFQNIRR